MNSPPAWAGDSTVRVAVGGWLPSSPAAWPPPDPPAEGGASASSSAPPGLDGGGSLPPSSPPPVEHPARLAARASETSRARRRMRKAVWLALIGFVRCERAAPFRNRLRDGLRWAPAYA